MGGSLARLRSGGDGGSVVPVEDLGNVRPRAANQNRDLPLKQALCPKFAYLLYHRVGQRRAAVCFAAWQSLAVLPGPVGVAASGAPALDHIAVVIGHGAGL